MAVAASRSHSDPRVRASGGGLTPSGHAVPELSCRLVDGPSDLATHHRIREAVFVAEQSIFDGTDRDPLDLHADTLHVLGFVDSEPVGTVRLYPIAAERPDEVLWKGDRLAVLAAHRQAGLGAPLVRFAVATAGRLGGGRMVAHVQLDNVVFFRRLGWEPVGGPAPYVGVEHQKMSIGLR